jgi:hypothetical protein
LPCLACSVVCWCFCVRRVRRSNRRVCTGVSREQGNYKDTIYGAYVFTSDFLNVGTTQPNDVLSFTVLHNTTSVHAAPIFLSVR